MTQQADRGVLLRTWLGATMISFSAVYVRLADVEPARSAFLRTAYALPAFALLLWWQRRRAADPGAPAPRLRDQLPLGAVIAGAFLGIDLVLWHVSVGLIGAGLGTVLPNLQVVFVGVAGVVLFRERPRGGFWVALPIVLLGVWLLGAVGRPVTTDGSVVLGVVFGVLTAAAYSVYLVVLRWTRLRHPGIGSVPMMAAATAGAAAAIGLWAAPQGLAAPAGEWPADGWLLLLALGSQVTGWLLLGSSIHRLPAALTSVALLLQPVLALVWGALLLGEPLGTPQVAGAAIVLAGVVLAHRAASVAGPPGGDQTTRRPEMPVGSRRT